MAVFPMVRGGAGGGKTNPPEVALGFASQGSQAYWSAYLLKDDNGTLSVTAASATGEYLDVTQTDSNTAKIYAKKAMKYLVLDAFSTPTATIVDVQASELPKELKTVERSSYGGVAVYPYFE